MKFVLLRISFPVLGRVPGTAERVLGFLAPFLLWHGSTRRSLRRTFLPLCAGNESRAAAASSRALREAGRYYVDLASLPYRRLEVLERDEFRIQHAERLAVLDEGPCVVIGAHTAGSELALRALLARGYDALGLVEPIRSRRLARFLLAWRTAPGGRFLEADRAGLRACILELRRGGNVLLMADRDIQRNGVCVEFFGRQARFPRGPWALAASTGAAVLPVLCARSDDDRIVVVIEEPIRVLGGRGREGAIAQAAQAWATTLEAFLAPDPGQWLMLEDFWRVHRCA